ncbi:MAG TPA: hypothetical protein V6D28_08135 [Leptolyngbyaceae cyanobacterium]
MKNLTWKVEHCPKCSSFAVKSIDGFWGCLKCRELAPDALSLYLEGKCIYCRQPLIPLMEACLSCGNQPKYLWEKPTNQF